MIIDPLPEKHRIRDTAARGGWSSLKLLIRCATGSLRRDVRLTRDDRSEIAARTGATDEQTAAGRELIRTGRAVEVTRRALDSDFRRDL